MASADEARGQMLVEHPRDVRRASTALHQDPCQSSAGLIDNSLLPFERRIFLGRYTSGRNAAQVMGQRINCTAPSCVLLSKWRHSDAAALPTHRVLRHGPGRSTAAGTPRRSSDGPASSTQTPRLPRQHPPWEACLNYRNPPPTHTTHPPVSSPGLLRTCQ